ncbi:MAG: hypothetical protein JO320_01425 [Alphaproteobacteria bacterium]|nr:hypothetical protein [Alphaproteobacteria bacterium]MBV9201820.1 hypothetical protein [Alphaproteobacteria bacterium]MBV9373718.1 hypothetical protein [Alphaproteobacteria bacterium]
MRVETASDAPKSASVVAGPFCQLGPAGTNEVFGIRGGHFDDAIRDGEMLAREGLRGPDIERSAQADKAFRVFGGLQRCIRRFSGV